MDDKALIELRRKWYKKLKKKGFDDIECLSPNGSFYPIMKGTFHREAPELQEAKRTYYEQCSEFLYNYQFKTRDERIIFQMHAEGETIRKIALALGLKEISVSRPLRTLKRLRLEMLKYFYGKARKDRIADLRRGAECA